MKRICHLVDDTSPGGVTRMLDFIQASEKMARLGDHNVIVSSAGLSKPPAMNADVIVSHIVLSWRNFPFFLALRARYPRTPIVHIEHHYSQSFVIAEVANPKRFKAMLSLSMSIFDRVIAISGTQYDWLRLLIQIAPEKIVLIPSCVALDAFLCIPMQSGPIKKIGAIGRLHPQKGFDLLIPAFRAAALPGVTLEIYGDGPDKLKLQALAGGDPAIVFHGFLPDPCAAMAAVDAVAMPSRREPYGLVALEAMAAGRPLLVSQADGLIDHAALGALAVTDFSVEAWSHALSDLIVASDATKPLAARQRVALAEDRCAASWSALLKGLI